MTSALNRRPVIAEIQEILAEPNDSRKNQMIYERGPYSWGVENLYRKLNSL
jgi:hypothetical protein